MRYDHIVVGAGSSGAVLAARLSEDPAVSVLLVEAGPDYPDLDQLPEDLRNPFAVSVVDHDWGFTAEAVPGRTIGYARGKVTGGCSAINGTIALRGNPDDFDEWAAWGNDEWSWDKCLPYFKKLEDDRDEAGDLHGQGGPIPIERWTKDELVPIQQAFLQACFDQGYEYAFDHNHPGSTGVGPIPMNRRGALRFSTAVGYLGPARNRPNLTIGANTMVNRVLTEGGRAIGVEVDDGHGPEQVYGDEITLSAGSLNTPAILMRSGIGPKADLEALGIEVVLDQPAVGANLIEHQQALVALIPKEGQGSTAATPDVQLVVEYTSPDGQDIDDMQIYLVNKLGKERLPELENIMGEVPWLFSVMVVLNRPKSRGVVALQSADPRQQPAIKLNSFDHPDDMARMLDGLRRCWSIATSGPMAELTQGVAIVTQETVDSDEALAHYIRSNSATIWHPVGTCKMGPAGDTTAVVDQHCRVHGIEGLRVVDASVFPNHTSRNPNLTCIMIAEKVADRMRAPGSA